MLKLGAVLAAASTLLLGASSPSAAGCVCKDARTTWCYACYSSHAVPAGPCSYWLDKRKQRKAKGAAS